jgi:hypothetical protein
MVKGNFWKMMITVGPAQQIPAFRVDLLVLHTGQIPVSLLYVTQKL